MLNRRYVVQALAGAGLAAGPLAGMATPAAAQTFSAAELAVPGPLGDVPMGSPDAKVTIYEYLSMTCPHCAAFHDKTFPTLKEKYIDTGKVRFVLREFPLDPLATAGFMLARCAGESKYHAMIDLLFKQQRVWAVPDRAVEALSNLVKQAGFTQDSFESCLKNQQIYDGVNAVRDRGATTFGVNSTPTFVINGQIVRGALSIEELDKILAPLVGS